MSSDLTPVQPPVPVQPHIKMTALLEQMVQSGFTFISSASMQANLLANTIGALSDWPAFVQSWNDMPLDQHMADGGRYRRRRYATLSSGVNGNIKLEPHQPHYQNLDYNILNGGVAREFEAIPAAIVSGSTIDRKSVV